MNVFISKCRCEKGNSRSLAFTNLENNRDVVQKTMHLELEIRKKCKLDNAYLVIGKQDRCLCLLWWLYISVV